jgi:hypothetical protein
LSRLRRKQSWEEKRGFLCGTAEKSGKFKMAETAAGAEVSRVDGDSHMRLEKVEGHQAVEPSLPEYRGSPPPQRDQRTAPSPITQDLGDQQPCGRETGTQS